MPKHAPSFKHLIATSSSSNRDKAKKERSVNELLAASRVQDSRLDGTHEVSGRSGRERPPHLSASGSASPLLSPGAGHEVERAWTVIPGQERAVGLDMDDASVHPAELLRRSQVAHHAASRSVAGPAPPPSWRGNPDRPLTMREAFSRMKVGHAGFTERHVSEAELRQSSELLSFHPQLPPARDKGVGSLVGMCLLAILRGLHDDTALGQEGDVPVTGEASQDDTAPLTIGQAMQEQLAYLEPHLKSALIDTSSLLPLPVPLQPGPARHSMRLSDSSVRAVLSQPPHEELSVIPNGCTGSSTEGDDWSIDPDIPSEIRHVSLCLHPSPLPLLRDISLFPGVTLTCIDLAYSTIRDIERLVGVLPPGLRELGLAGIRLAYKGRVSSAIVEDDARRGMAALGRKMLVLKVLDLSYIPELATPTAVTALLCPPKARLPSLRLLGLRSARASEIGSIDTYHSVNDQDRRLIRNITRDTGRTGLIDIVW